MYVFQERKYSFIEHFSSSAMLALQHRHFNTTIISLGN